MQKKKNILANTLTTMGLAALTVPGSAQAIHTSNVQSSAAVRPFHFHASDEALADLRGRVRATRWPDAEIVKDETQGVKLATTQKLANYWATKYDWRKCEAKLDAVP